MATNTGELWTLYTFSVLLILALIVITDGEKHTAMNSTDANLKFGYHFAFSQNCSIDPVSPTLRRDLKQLLDAGIKLIHMDLKIENHTGTLPGQSKSNIYQPLRWERSTGKHGRGLLFLKTGFRFLSLSTLNHGVQNMAVELAENPKGCLVSKHVEEIESLLRVLLLNDFQEIGDDGSGGSLEQNEHVCNMHIKSVDGHAHFYYVCCHKNVQGDISCEDLVQDFWISLLLYCIKIMFVLILMFSPYLVPASWFKEKYRMRTYEFSCPSPIEIRIKKKKLMNTHSRTNVMNLSKFSKTTAPLFRKTLDELEENTVYLLKISKLLLHVKSDRLLPSNYVPVGIFRSIYDSLFRCQIREKESLKPCCYSNVFGLFTPLDHTFKWYKCLQQLMKFVLLFLFVVPWLCRIYVYYLYEDSEMQSKSTSAEQRHLHLDFHLPESIVTHIGPIHGLFVFCYMILILDCFVMGFLSKEVKDKFQFILRKCFRDMHEISKAKAMGWVAKRMLYPFQKFGICAIVIIPFYWLIIIPFLFFILLFYFVPSLNIFVRLLVHFFASCVPLQFLNKLRKMVNTLDLMETESLAISSSVHRFFGVRVLNLFIIGFGILTLFSFVLLAMECALFFVEIVVYTWIGIILNASYTLKYVSLTFMFVLYARGCFGSVTKQYLTFNQSINQAVLKKVEEEVANVAWQSADTQPNTAFQIKTDDRRTEKSDIKLVISNGVLKWNLPRVVFFLDKNDTPLIARTFFFETVYMPHSGCPGHLFSNLLKAVRQLLTIILFLLFVLLVVKAFGEEYSVSGVNQMLATLAGGFLPWIFRNVLFKALPGFELDTESLAFRNLFNDVLHNFEQNWPVADIVVDSTEVDRSFRYSRTISEENGLDSFGYVDPGSMSMLDNDTYIDTPDHQLDLLINTRSRAKNIVIEMLEV